jgi:RND family efflux transporter MFP subunit
MTVSSPPHPLASRRLRVGLLAALLAAVLATGCNHGSSAAQEKKAVEVFVTTPITDEVTDYQDFTGRLDAVKSVDIRARVSGYVTEVPFKEGDEVREGDLLFQIDPQPYQADLNQAEANLKVVEADRGLQLALAERGRMLYISKAIAKEEYETLVAAAKKSEATVGANQAARDRAKLYLDYTRVTAPLTGRVSRRYVDPGNLVNADTTLLTSLVTVNPLYAYFDVDERTYLDLTGVAARGQSSWFSQLQFPVLMRLANEDEFTHAGTVNFLDNQVNANTGTIRMRGEFKDEHGTLKKGLFARIRLPLGAPYKAILIPDEALQSDQGRKYVYVVKTVKKEKDGQQVEKDVVEYRSVTLGQAIKGLRVIKEGLKEGERVIVVGMQRVRADAEVQAKMQDPPPPPHSPLTKLLSSLNRAPQKAEAGGQ